MSDFDVKYAKTGMLSRAETVEIVAEKVADHRLKVIVDPVMASESGGRLLNPDAVDTLKKETVADAEVDDAQYIRSIGTHPASI